MAELRQGLVIGGKYRLEAPLAGGGMGSVWRGSHLGLDIPIAIKFMRGDLEQSPRARARFEREAKAAALIRSPHVVHVYDHGIDDSTPFIVMELLEGEDLASRIDRLGIVPFEEAVRICREMCKGLHHAHCHGVVHRDLKPSNIFLCAPHDDMVKILDFGVARAYGLRSEQSQLTTEGSLLGSPNYMSPEQVRGADVDGRSDLWAVGVILYRMLTGRRPFEARDVGDLVVAICMDPIAPPSFLRAELDTTVDRFFERALCRDPEGRFATARQLAVALEDALVGISPSQSLRRPLPSDGTSWDDAATTRRYPDAAAGYLVTAPTVPAAPRAQTAMADTVAVPSPPTESNTVTDWGSIQERAKRTQWGVAAGAVLVAIVGVGGAAAALTGSPAPTAHVAFAPLIRAVADAARQLADDVDPQPTEASAPPTDGADVAPPATVPGPPRSAKAPPALPTPRPSPKKKDDRLGY